MGSDEIATLCRFAPPSRWLVIGARPTWTTGDTNVAVVLQDGSVIARGPGVTLVSVVVGSHVAQSRLHVKQKVASIQFDNVSGDSGVVVAGEGGRLTAVFEQHGGVARVRPNQLGAVETVYAMTVHKSQGSQFATAAVILPPPSSRILTRELLYTAVSRRPRTRDDRRLRDVAAHRC